MELLEQSGTSGAALGVVLETTGGLSVLAGGGDADVDPVLLAGVRGSERRR